MSNWLIVGGGYGTTHLLDARLKIISTVFIVYHNAMGIRRAMLDCKHCKSLNVPLVNMLTNIFHDLHAWDGYDRNKVGKRWS